MVIVYTKQIFDTPEDCHVLSHVMIATFLFAFLDTVVFEKFSLVFSVFFIADSSHPIC